MLVSEYLWSILHPATSIQHLASPIFIIRFAIIGHVHAAVPCFEPLQHFVALHRSGPYCFTLLEPNFVRTFANAIFLSAIVGRGRDPYHTIERHMLVIDATKNRHL